MSTLVTGALRIPKASWKYTRIERLFGFGAAKYVQLAYNRLNPLLSVHGIERCLRWKADGVRRAWGRKTLRR